MGAGKGQKRRVRSSASRPAPTHPLVVGKENFRGEIYISGDEEIISAVEGVCSHILETGAKEGWNGGNAAGNDVFGISDWSPEKINKVERLGELLAHEDAFEYRGFIVHNFGSALDVHMRDEESLKDLETMVKSFEDLGLQLSYDIDPDEAYLWSDEARKENQAKPCAPHTIPLGATVTYNGSKAEVVGHTVAEDVFGTKYPEYIIRYFDTGDESGGWVVESFEEYQLIKP